MILSSDEEENVEESEAEDEEAEFEDEAVDEEIASDDDEVRNIFHFGSNLRKISRNFCLFQY